MKLTPLPLTVSARITTGLPIDGAGLRECVDNLAHVVAVDAQHLPAEARVLVGERLHLHHVFHPAVDLQAVAVDDGDDVVELEVAGLHRRFPHLALLLLAVAHQAKDLVLLAPSVSTRAASAMPTAMLRPWPSEPEEISTPGI